jgi:hypothetical protein
MHHVVPLFTRRVGVGLSALVLLALLVSIGTMFPQNSNATSGGLIFTPLGSTGGQIESLAVSAGKAYIGNGEHFSILDVSTPANPQLLVNERLFDDIALDLAVDGTFVYVANRNDGVQIVDVSSPTAPTIVSSVPNFAEHIAIAGDTIYAATQSELTIIDVSTPASPSVLGTYTSSGSFFSDLDVIGTTVYLVDGSQGSEDVKVIDASVPASPTVIGSYNTSGFAQTIDVVGTMAYVFDGTDGLLVLDVSNPAAISQLGSFSLFAAEDIEVVGSIAYIGSGVSGLRAFDVSTPSAISEIGSLTNPADSSSILDVDGSEAYVVYDTTGVQVVDVSTPSNLQELADSLFVGTASDIALSGTTAYVSSGNSGLRILDVTNPTTPTLENSYITNGGAGDIDVVGSWAYFVDAFGFDILDISTPLTPSLESSTNITGFAQSSDVMTNTAYVTTLSSGLQILDISNPASPSILGTYGLSGAGNDVKVIHDTAYVADGTDGLLVLDVSTPVSPTLLGSYDTGVNNLQAIEVISDTAYLIDGSGQFQVVDVSTPAAPIQQGTFSLSGFGRDIDIIGTTAYVVAGNLSVLDVSDPSNPTSLGSYGFSYTSVEVDGDIAYLTNIWLGLEIVRIEEVPEPTASPTPTATTTAEPSPSPTATAEPSPSPTATVEPSPSPTATPEPDITVNFEHGMPGSVFVLTVPDLPAGGSAAISLRAPGETGFTPLTTLTVPNNSKLVFLLVTAANDPVGIYTIQVVVQPGGSSVAQEIVREISFELDNDAPLRTDRPTDVPSVEVQVGGGTLYLPLLQR